MIRRGPHPSVVVLGLARMADAVANSFLIIVLPLYIASREVQGEVFGLSTSAVTGIILAVFGVCNALTQPFAGRISDRLGRRKVFVLGGLLIVAGLNTAYAFADAYWQLLLLRSGQGLGVAFTVTASVALVNEVSTPWSRGENMGTYNSLRLLGFGAGPLAAGFIVSSGPYGIGGLTIDGFDAAFYLASAGALLSAGLVLLFVRDARIEGRAVERLAIAVRSARPDRLLDPIFTLGVATLVAAGCISLLSTIEPQVNAHLGQGPRWFGVQFAVFILSMAASQPMIGRASDQWGRRRFVLVGLFLLLPTTLAQGLAFTPVQMVAARLAQGVAGAMVFAPALALAGDLARKGQSGLQLSVLTMSFGLGLAAGQLSSGFLVRWGYLMPFAAGSCAAVVAALIVWREVEEPVRA